MRLLLQFTTKRVHHHAGGVAMSSRQGRRKTRVSIPQIVIIGRDLSE